MERVEENDARIVLYGRQQCHLCDVAKGVLRRLHEETGEPFVEVDVDTDPTLKERYGDLVPVVTVDGEEQGHWRIDGDQVRRALAASPR